MPTEFTREQERELESLDVAMGLSVYTPREHFSAYFQYACDCYRRGIEREGIDSKAFTKWRRGHGYG